VHTRRLKKPGQREERNGAAFNQSKKLRIYITIVCISFLQGLQFGPSPVLAQIQEHFPSVSTSLIQMLITAPSIVGMVFAVVCGILVTKISKKKLLLLSSAVAFIT
jgi:predicted MFS family arabinose efflux permease